MSRRVKLLVSIAIVCSAHLATAIPASCQQSPTGQTPHLLWTPQQQAIWARMKAEYDSNPVAPATLGARWYGLMKAAADAGDRYLDNGNWATLLFQITGDLSYVDKAWNRLEATLFAMPLESLGGDYARENFEEYVIIYDWLYPGLSATRRARLLDRLNQMANACVKAPNTDPAAPIRMDDSDQTTGSYFGLAFLYLVTKDYNTSIVQIFESPYVGGFAATGADRRTLRNAIEEYVTVLARGGEWMESSEYNLGTLRLLLMGAQGVKTATGRDYFAAVKTLSGQLAIRQVQFLTPDRLQSIQWGDEQQPRHLYLKDWITLSAMLAGFVQDDPTSGPAIQDLVYKLTEQYGWTGSNAAEPWARAFLFYNPYAPRGSTDALPLGFGPAGQGFTVTRTGWKNTASLFVSHFRPKQSPVDHEVGHFGNFQLYRGGTWALTHPITYSGLGYKADTVNSMLLGAMSSGYEFRELTASTFSPDGRFAYSTGTTGGQMYWPDYWDPPPTFLHEWSRSIVYLAGDQDRATVIVYDRTNADDPRQLPKLDRYLPDDKARITAAAASKEWIIHAASQPAVTNHSAVWSAPGSQQVVVTSLLPAAATLRVLDESQLFAGTGIADTERHWQVRISPAQQTRWNTFLAVVDVHDTVQMTLPTTLVTADNATSEGVLVGQNAERDVLVVFNAVPSQPLPPITYNETGRAVLSPDVPRRLRTARLRTTASTVAWTSSKAFTDIVLADFSPARAVRLTVDAKPMVVTADSAGLIRVTVSGAARHVVSVSLVPAPPTNVRIIK